MKTRPALDSLADEREDDPAARTPAAPALFDTSPADAAIARRPFLLVVAGPQAGELAAVGATPLLIGRDPGCGLRLRDGRVSRRHAEVTAADGVLRVRDLRSTNGTFVAGRRVRGRRLRDGDRLSLGGGHVVQVIWLDALEEQVQRQLSDAALRDGLTGAYNRRYLRQRMATELAYAMRHGTPIALLLLDVDHFKQVNDRHGHLQGDAVLRALCQVVLSELRSEDVLARWGGEEFAILARSTTDLPALGLGERVRERVARASFPHGQPLRVSIGVAVFPGEPRLLEVARAGVDEDSPLLDALVGLADEALYCAKRRGRDRVVSSTEVWLDTRTSRARALLGADAH